MSENEKKEFDVVWSDQVRAKAEEDPEFAEALRDFSACARQAMAGVRSGQYKSFDEAIEAITGERPVPIYPDDENEDG